MNGSGEWVDMTPVDQPITHYSAPEIILETDFSLKVDIWALGCAVRRQLTVFQTLIFVADL